MQAVFDRWPNVVVQFEDFETPKALPILTAYRDKYRCFNDDIQGTGSVTLAGILAAARNAGTSITEMSFLCAGAGSAGLGVCQQIVDGMVEAGLPREEAMARFVVCSSVGAIGKPDGSHGDPHHKRGLSSDRAPWVHPTIADGTSMLDVVKTFQPTCLLGLAAQPAGLFSEELVRAMSYTQTPIVMPMSNPTAKAECTPQQAYEWTDGRAIVATGSPFDPVEINGRTLIPSQCNNMYVFPGIGLAASVAGASRSASRRPRSTLPPPRSPPPPPPPSPGVSRITDKMLYQAAVACTDAMTEDEIASGRTFPAISRIREISKEVACNVIEVALDENLCTKLSRKDVPTRDALSCFVNRKMYFPAYVPLVDPAYHRKD